jgi:exopolysaccharide biosynthesis polyprenyl glycosylphosphotransferase
MLKRRWRAIDGALRLIDLMVLAVAFPLAYYLRDSVSGDELGALFPMSRYLSTIAPTLLLWIGASAVCNVYGNYRTRTLTLELGRLVRAGALVAGGLGALAFFSKQYEVSRLFLGLYALLAVALLVLNRLVVRGVARAARRRGRNTRRFAVMGGGAPAREIVENMARHQEWGIDFAGFVHDGDSAPPKGMGRVLGSVDALRRVFECEVIDELIIAAPDAAAETVQKALVACEEMGISARICMAFPMLRISRVALDDLGGIPSIAFSPVPTDTVALVAKRAFDLAVSAAALVCLAPLLAIVAAAIRLDSPGPVLFRQRRVGRNGRTFEVLKFRSMYRDAEQKLHSLRARNEMSGPVFKLREDPRVTRVGRFIRKTSIDELPQFWNVVRGEMSVVGPRPPLPREVEQYEPWQRRRLSVKPGITCTWQVSGRNDIDFDRWMELDLKYIDDWSLWNDFTIVLKTIPAVFNGR